MARRMISVGSSKLTMTKGDGRTTIRLKADGLSDGDIACMLGGPFVEEAEYLRGWTSRGGEASTWVR